MFLSLHSKNLATGPADVELSNWTTALQHPCATSFVALHPAFSRQECIRAHWTVLNTSKRVTEKQKDLLNGVVNSKMHESGKQLVATTLISCA